jgi:PAP2 superfamily
MANRLRNQGINDGTRRGWCGAIMAALLLTVSVGLTPHAAPRAAASEHPDAPPNPVIAWDIHAQNAIFEVARQPPTTASRSFAIVQGAVYDAVNTIAGTPYEPYLVAPPSRPGDSTPAAVATAAYRVLLWMFPAQADALGAQYAESLAAIPDGPAKDGGIAVGEATAAAMIEARVDDGAFDPSRTWPVGTDPGVWRPTPPNFLQTGGWFPTLEPFVVPDASAYRTPGPPPLASAAYARDQREVQRIGSATSKARTRDQTEAAIWWDDPRQVEWSIRRQLATTHRLSTLQTARLFAMVDITAADALIACYEEKLFWGLWRPVTAIPLADTDGNPATRADPGWTPLRVTAPSPEYPSGHACYTSAVTSALRTFFGRDAITFSASSAASGTTRSFDRLSTAMAELMGARVWAGVHYRFASVDGERLGAVVARDVLDNAFGRHDD